VNFVVSDHFAVVSTVRGFDKFELTAMLNVSMFRIATVR